MICRECGKGYVGLGVHVRAKHGMTRNDYCLRHDLPLGTALVDDDLAAHMSAKAKERLHTDEGAEHLELMRRNRVVATGPHQIPECSKGRLRALNAQKSARRTDIIPRMLPDWLAGMIGGDICAKYGMCYSTLGKWVARGLLPMRKSVLVPVRG